MAILDDFPRVRINCLPTPLSELKRLSRALGGPRILMKRDDLTGVALGGNKTRKLEFLLGEALRQGCDAVLACGAAQSNLCRQTAGAAAAAGLQCHLALGGAKPPRADYNLLVDLLQGATVHWCGEYEKGETLPAIAGELKAAGLRPYVIPYGGSTPVGALGFVAAMAELREQALALQVEPDWVVVPTSSCGTQAGMAVGLEASRMSARVVGFAIDRGAPGDPPYEAQVAELATRTARLLGLGREFRAGDILVDYRCYGRGYEILTDDIREAVTLTARQEGILLDPIYNGRAMAGLIDRVRKGEFRSGQTVVYWHTGGLPALFRFAGDLGLG
ncbi:MAG: D-cysteine desulfhydrase family protein [Holophaga sp.]|jgi:D-cysteine desulfhydrase